MIHILEYAKYSLSKVKKLKKHLSSDDKPGTQTIMAKFGSLAKPKKTISKLDEFLNSVKKRFGVKDIKYKDCGAFGMAFVCDGDKVLKITEQESEAVECKKLCEEEVKGCVKYYDIVRSKKWGVWIVLMQRADELSEVDSKLIEYTMDFVSDSDWNEDKSKSLKKIRDQYQKNENVSISKQKVEEVVSEYFNLRKSLKEAGVSVDDAHPGNLGRIKGKLVLFDPMSNAVSGENFLKRISKID